VSGPVPQPAPGDATPVRASVCMATYNGEAFVAEQVDSVLAQLGEADELVVVDDASTDDTARLLAAYDDPRVRLVANETNQGYVRTFERALTLARGDRLFLADQDDVWVPGRLDTMLDALERSAVVSTSVAVLGEPLDPPRFRLRARDSRRHLANLFAVMVGYRPYTGCAMAFRRDIFDSVVPVPPFVHESHDLWIAMVANTHRENLHLEEASVMRRLHGGNQTPLGWRSLPVILRARVMKARALAVAARRASARRGRVQTSRRTSAQ
jgi:glycosyltransferase involved in cell wall biosynthesis